MTNEENIKHMTREEYEKLEKAVHILKIQAFYFDEFMTGTDYPFDYVDDKALQNFLEDIDKTTNDIFKIINYIRSSI